MLALCLWAILSLAAGTVWQLEAETQTILDYADNAVCGLFFVDFLISLKRAPGKWAYLASWGWIDLLSSIPTVDALRWGRAARLMRILRVLRGVKSARAIAHFLVERRAQSAFLAAMLLSLLLLVFASIAMLHFETTPDSNIRTAEDALWWAISTMTTVGYGDTYPITPEGRMVAVFLMAAGVGIFGTFSGLVASWFLSPAAEETDSDVEELKAMVADIQRRLPPSRGDGGDRRGLADTPPL
jgi:voltage-gated potassium channel